MNSTCFRVPRWIGFRLCGMCIKVRPFPVFNSAFTPLFHKYRPLVHILLQNSIMASISREPILGQEGWQGTDEGVAICSCLCDTEAYADATLLLFTWELFRIQHLIGKGVGELFASVFAQTFYRINKIISISTKW